MRGTLVVALAASSLALAPWAEGRQQPVFRTDTQTVFVDVSVKRGNNPVPGLQAADFVLTDNGVPQRVDAVAIEAVPVDVSLFVDTSGSMAGVIEEMKNNVREISAMLQAGDRFRLLTIGVSVYQPLAWTDAGQPISSLDLVAVSGNSLVYDAVYAAVTHAVAPGRRHLVVSLTYGYDCGSVVRPAQLRDLIGRTDAVVHWVPMGGSTPFGAFRGARAMCADSRRSQELNAADLAAFEALVTGTGGLVHTGFRGVLVGNSSVVKAFRKVLDDYRRSYVLHYTPEGVSRPGWHQLKVDVPSGKYTIRARSGYFGG